MKKNYQLFLTFGLILSLLSKILQRENYWLFGNILVIFAAFCFVCAFLFALKKFQIAYTEPTSKKQALTLLVSLTTSIICFQMMMMLVLSHLFFGFLFLIPIIITGVLAWKIGYQIFSTSR